MTIELAWTTEAVDETIRPDDAAAITSCALDYFEGWFDGDATRMERALHPGLAKHAIGQDAERSRTLDVTSKDEMVEAAGRGLGRRRDVPDRAIRIEIVAVSGDIASVVVHSAVYVEYLLMARADDGWRITSTIWRWADGNGPRA